MIYFDFNKMQNIEQFVRERHEIKPLQTCESYFLTFPK